MYEQRELETGEKKTKFTEHTDVENTSIGHSSGKWHAVKKVADKTIFSVLKARVLDQLQKRDEYEMNR